MKKTIVALALSAVMLTAMPLTVFAHGHSHGTDSSAACNSLCSVENCMEAIMAGTIIKSQESQSLIS